MKNEWSLIFFTFLTQTAIGLFIVLAGLNVFSMSKTESILSKELVLKILYVILVLTIVAIVSSFLHLGKPRNAIYALTNISSSWLSREILFVILFFGISLLYTFFEYFMIGSDGVKLTFAILGILIGLLAVFSMGKLYFLETVPAWNSINTFIQFYSTVILLGIISFLLMILLFDSSLLNQFNSANTNKIISVILILFLAIGLISFLYNLWSLSGGGQTALESLEQIIDQNAIIFYFRIILSTVTILFLIYKLLVPENTYSSTIIILLSTLIILTEISARYLFYVGYKRIGV